MLFPNPHAIQAQGKQLLACEEEHGSEVSTKKGFVYCMYVSTTFVHNEYGISGTKVHISTTVMHFIGNQAPLYCVYSTIFGLAFY